MAAGLNPRLRPWRQAGLRYLLADEERARAWRLEAFPFSGAGRGTAGGAGAAVGMAAQAGMPFRSDGRPPAPGFARPGTCPGSPPGNPSGWRSPEARPGVRGDQQGTIPPGYRGATPASALRKFRPDPPQPPRGSGAAGEVPEAFRPPVPPGRPGFPGPAPSDWPPFWQDCLKKAPRRSLLLWTYADLGGDLAGTLRDEAHSARVVFLRALIADMGLPKGNNAFWPFNSGEGQSVDARHFWDGVRVIEPHMVVFMCGSPPPGLGLEALRLLQVLESDRRYILLTYHIDQLLDRGPRYRQFLAFLKSQIHGAF